MGRFRSTAVLVLLFVVLFSYFWIYQKDKKAPEPTPVPGMETPTTVLLTTVKADDLVEVSWKSASYSATLQNTNQKWTLIQPPGIITDDTKIKSYIDSIVSLSGSRKYSTKELPFAETGLDKPALTLVLKKKDNSTETIKVGNKTIDGDYYYALRDGSDDITLLGSYVIDDLNKDPNSLKLEPSTSPVSGAGAIMSTGTPTPQF